MPTLDPKGWHHEIDTGLWFRPFRQLLQDGKPVGEIVALQFAKDGQMTNAFGALQITRGNHIVFWPACTGTLHQDGAGGHPFSVDHISVNVRNCSIHFTGFNSNGLRTHRSTGKQVVEMADGRLSFCFGFAVQWSVLESQPTEQNIAVPFPNTDRVRREQEYRKALSQLKLIPLPLPHPSGAGNFGLCPFYICNGSGDEVPFGANCVPRLNQIAKNWPGDSVVLYQGMKQPIGDKMLLLAFASPPGILPEAACFALGNGRKNSKWAGQD
ncbi:MAG: hypothetical protein WD042_19595 [Phycisphaeraceae bacterium]